MKRRLICLILVAVTLVSMVNFGVSAEANMKTSDEAVAVLKAEEGFSAKPYWDYAQWTVGYGTKCPEDMLNYYKQYGITEAEAELLLRTYLAKFESELHNFINRTGIKLTQNQFDALLLFTYNCGSGWTYNTEGLFYNAIVSGATGNDLIYAFSRWCSAGGQILTSLLRRRLCEANMYLNGVYSQTIPENYGYVLYDACVGKTSPTVQGYDTVLTAEILSKPTHDGHSFAGWYTAETGGTKVTVLDATTRNLRLYAHWTDGEGNDTSEDIQGVTVTVNATGVNIRSGPGTNHAVVSTANYGDKFVIIETATGSGYTWGKFSTGWICLQYTDYDKAVIEQQKPESPEVKPEPTPEVKPEPTPEVKPESKPEQNPTPTIQMGTVKVSDCLRVRSGPNTGYAVAGYLYNGDRVEILEQKIVGTMVWGRISAGWISLSYVTLDKPENNDTSTETPNAVATGVVKVNEFLRIRSGPGTAYSVAGYLTPNAQVSILETKQSECMTWGKISQGWISLDYVVLDKQETQKPEKVTGIVKVNDYLRIRSGAGTSYAIAGYLSNNAKVEITEQKTVGGTVWGKIAKGWISMDYVVLDHQSTTNKVVKTVTADCLRIRSAAGTSNTIVGYLYSGAKVEILETKKVGNMTWGKVSKGWISMDYVK